MRQVKQKIVAAFLMLSDNNQPETLSNVNVSLIVVVCEDKKQTQEG